MAMIRLTLFAALIGLTGTGCLEVGSAIVSASYNALFPKSQLELGEEWATQVCACVHENRRRSDQLRCLREKADPKQKEINWDGWHDEKQMKMNAARNRGFGCLIWL